MPGGRRLKENLYSLDSAPDVCAFLCICVRVFGCVCILACLCVPELNVWLMQ